MALDLAKLQEFRIETESQDTLLCKNFTISVMEEIQKWLDENKEQHTKEFAIKMASLLCHIVDQGEEDSFQKLSYEQAERLSDNDLESFAKCFIEKNSNFLDDPEKKEIIREKDKNGKIVGPIKKHPADDLLKGENETYVDHLYRATKFYIKNYNKRSKELFEKATKSIFSNSTMELFEQNELLSERLGNSLSSPHDFEIPPILENPAYETNRTLSSMANELQQTAFLLKNLNDLGIQIVKDTVAASKRNKFWNNMMFGLGIFTLFASALLSYLALISANNSSTTQIDLLDQQKELLSALNTMQKEDVDTISEISGLIETGIHELEELKPTLDNVSAGLKNITSQSSSQPTAARTPEDGASD